ncbi:Gfo/Idh/MocA family oxidoreductase [Phytohabitans sp. ZYX-F-186]|uniref:Gfo/Idh/MocA family oxidoreductase n=1 Tax=Phytohabitans maris TaxID=3071409 RepID=A0ABU0ZSB6_9ACTN|nr:Gfo/Idh/MocA family oxidoreductase [Phytohabitans sp. ZYX-F-186]MDQ7909897.1 Gfo/Idh/MocA family oxidoreductase [Phytohabitans sp. ZYX-F-186]
MSGRRYRTAIVGTGGIAVAHAQALQGLAHRADLVAVADVDVSRAKTFAERWNVPHAHDGVTELLDAQQLDLVHLCTPPEQHAPLALRCLRAGASVLVEKPPTLSLAEFDALAAAEHDSTGHVATVFQHRFGSAATRLRRMAAAGELGRPLLATCATQWYRDDDYFAAPWRGTWESEGGGPTMGHGIHQFDLLLSILGPWREVTALAARQARPTDTEDVSMALVSFDNGAVASVVNSVVSPRQTSTLRFDYEHATVEVEHLYGYDDKDWTLTPAPGHDAVLAGWTAEGDNIPSGHAAQLGAVFDALDRGEPPPVTLTDARRTMDFVAALYASAFTGERVRSGQIGPDSPFATRMDGTGAPWKETSTP